MTTSIQPIQTLLDRVAAQYRGDPNIVTIGFGLRSRGGQPQAERVIVFFVRDKLPSERQVRATGSTPIPDRIDGFGTDVQQFRPALHSAGDRDEVEFDPLVGGCATSNAEGHIYWFNTSGTLGMLVRDATDGTPMALSNFHVWADGGDEGDDIIQPGHPTAGDHVEAVGKVLACGPLLSSLIEWEVPSPLTGGLYGGAAAAAIAAAASDVRDPTRRGQDHTVPGNGERTLAESVRMEIEYPDLPLPGVPFETSVRWKYERTTTGQPLSYEVEEVRANAQFLLGKYVQTDRSTYGAGDRVRIAAAIWDYQDRRCDAYHVVAHLIPHARPTTALRVLLSPTTCPRTFPRHPPEQGDDLCVDFNEVPLGRYDYKGVFDWLVYLETSQTPVNVVDWLASRHGLQIYQSPLAVSHEPTTRIRVTLATFTNTPITVVAHNGAGVIVGSATTPADQGVPHTLTIEGEGIVRASIRGGGGEGLLLGYCIRSELERPVAARLTRATTATVRLEAASVEIEDGQVRARRCCFAGETRLPPDEPAGKWDVYVTVQNINDVPQGTPPDKAATTIGGHLLSSHTSEVIACTTVMLLDDVFDVI